MKKKLRAEFCERFPSIRWSDFCRSTVSRRRTRRCCQTPYLRTPAANGQTVRGRSVALGENALTTDNATAKPFRLSVQGCRGVSRGYPGKRTTAHTIPRKGLRRLDAIGGYASAAKKRIRRMLRLGRNSTILVADERRNPFGVLFISANVFARSDGVSSVV